MPGTNFDHGVVIDSLWSTVGQPTSYAERLAHVERVKHFIHPQQVAESDESVIRMCTLFHGLLFVACCVLLPRFFAPFLFFFFAVRAPFFCYAGGGETVPAQRILTTPHPCEERGVITRRARLFFVRTRFPNVSLWPQVILPDYLPDNPYR